MPTKGSFAVVSRGSSWRTLAAACMFLALILVSAWPAPARATTLERMSIDQLSRRATMVVEGTVVSTAVEQTPAGVRTAVRVRVHDVLKGVPSTLKTVYVPGGALPDGSQVVVDAMASFRAGDACYVFVDTRGWVIGGFQGKLDVAGGRVLGRGVTTATMSRRIKAALHAAKPAARPTSGARADAWPPKYFLGNVSDSTDGHMLPEVVVQATQPSTGFVYTTTTDATGYYRLDLNPDPSDQFGKYDVEFSKEGYQTKYYPLMLSLLWTAAAGPADGRVDEALTPGTGPTITSITPGEASAGTDTHVTISGTNFTATQGNVEFSYGRNDVMRISASDISSWTDTSINCAVPTALIDNYPASAGSGPVVVTTSTGVESNAYDFVVPFGYGGHKWAAGGATYFVNTSGIDDALRESLVDAGTAVWNAAGSGFTFDDGGTTTLSKAQDDTNVISWADGLPAGVIGQASSYYDASGNMTESDVQFSNAFAWGDGLSGSGTMDIQTITMHEVGHWLRLLDQYMDNDSGKVMYGYGSEDLQKRTLAAGDLAGITWIYADQPVDSVGPVCAAKNVTVKRGKTCKLYFKVYDALSAQVTTRLAITTKSGAIKKRWSWGYDRNVPGWWWMKYTCRLPRGTYRIVVTGKDLAGNPQSRVGRATLKVK
jgi:Carboxypeptidase regulatory-like domain/IPT/TIG domain